MYSNDIHMEMGLGKFKIKYMEKRKSVETEDYQIEFDTLQHIKGIGPDGSI